MSFKLIRQFTLQALAPTVTFVAAAAAARRFDHRDDSAGEKSFSQLGVSVQNDLATLVSSNVTDYLPVQTYRPLPAHASSSTWKTLTSVCHGSGSGV